MSHISVTLPNDGDLGWGDTLNAAINSIVTKVNAEDDITTTQVIPSGGTTGQVLAKTSNSNYAVGWTSAGGGGTTTVTGAAGSTATVYSAAYPHDRPSSSNSATYTWVGDGAADDVEINAAIAAVAAAGGGRVQLLGPSFYLANPIKLKTGVWLNGEGLGQEIFAAGSMTGGMVTLYDESVHATTVSNFTLDGTNKDCGAGIYYYSNSGQIFTSSPATNPDPAHQIQNLYIRATGTSTSAGHGIHLAGSNMRGLKVSSIRIQSVTGCGVWLDNSVDSEFVNMDIGSSGSGGPAASTSSTAPVGVGFYVSGANNQLTNIKCWYSRSVGYYNHGTRNQYSNCQAQDNYSHGFQDVYGKTTYVGCGADSNGQTSTSAGFNFSALSVSVVGCQSFDRGGQAWQQTYGFQVNSAVQYSSIIGCTTYGNSGSSTTGTAGTGTTFTVIGDSAGN